MNYIKDTFKYMARAFWALAITCLPAAIVLGVFTQPMKSLSYLVDYARMDVHGFKDIFWLFFNRYATTHVYPVLLILLAMLFSVSLTYSVIEKHFRVGKLGLSAPLRQVNNYFLPVMFTLLILGAVLIVYGLIQTSLTTILHAFCGRGKPPAWNVILTAAVSVALFVLSMYAAASTMYWAPMMVIYGFGFRDAAAASFRLVDRKTGEILIGVVLPFLLVAVLQSVFCLMVGRAVRIVLAIVLYLFLLSYMLSYGMISMFDLSDMDRRDLRGKRGTGEK